MRVERRDIINAPAEKAFLVLRDKMSEFLVYLPNIERIQVEERKESPGQVDTIIRWYGRTEIPEVAKKFVKPEFLSWIDTATWREADFSIDYQITSPVAKGLLKIGGKNQLIPKGPDKSELHVTCDFEVYPEKMPGVPRFMASFAKKPIEDLVRKMFEPNLMKLAEGLNKYFK